MSNLPPSIQRELEAADAIVAAQQTAPADPGVLTDVSQAAQLLTATASPPATPPEPSAPAAPPAAPSENWEQKYRTALGRYNAEVPQLRTENQVLKSQMNNLQEQVRALTAAAAKPAEPPKPNVDPRDVEQFGDQMMEMVHRHIAGVLQTMGAKVDDAFRAIDGRVQALEASVKGVAQETAESREAQFWAVLEQLVPDYAAINDSDGWKAWLTEEDRLTGFPRQAALNAAQKAMDARRVAAIFEIYKASLPRSRASELENQVSPSTSGATAAPVAAAPAPRITQKFIADFYRAKQQGKFVGREAEATQIEAAIDKAVAEGRVQL